jgi:hypothetical protein
MALLMAYRGFSDSLPKTEKEEMKYGIKHYKKK